MLALDLDADRVNWAAANVHVDAPGRIEFQAADFTTLGLENEIDVVVSKDTFEHVEHLDELLKAMRRALKTTGRIWAGSSPLYYSPFGDHGRTGMVVPWAHVLPEQIVYKMAARHQGKTVTSLADIGLNGMTPAEFRSYVSRAGLAFDSILYNRSGRLLMPVFEYLRRFGPLERYVTVGIYTVLRPA